MNSISEQLEALPQLPYSIDDYQHREMHGATEFIGRALISLSSIPRLGLERGMVVHCVNGLEPGIFASRPYVSVQITDGLLLTCMHAHRFTSLMEFERIGGKIPSEYGEDGQHV